MVNLQDKSINRDMISPGKGEIGDDSRNYQTSFKPTNQNGNIEQLDKSGGILYTDENRRVDTQNTASGRRRL